MKVHVAERPGQVDRHIGSTEKLERLTGWRARTSFEARARADRRVVSRERGLVAGSPRARPRLLVLGAGPAQLGLLRAARERGLYVIAVDRDPGRAGLPLRRHARASSRAEDEPAVERLARAERVDGIISPGADWPVGIAARVAERLGLPHPLDGGDGRARDVEAAPARALRRGRARRSRRVLDRAVACPCVVKAPDRQGQRGLDARPRSEAELAGARSRRLAPPRATARFIVEEYVDGPEVTVNAVSVDGVFHPLTVTDRLTAEPPAFGVALAHAWPARLCRKQHKLPSTRLAPRPRRSGSGTGRRTRRSGSAPDGPRVIELAARLGGGHDAELCELALGVDLNGLALDFALGDERKCCSRTSVSSAAPACSSSSRPAGELRAVEGRRGGRGRRRGLEVRVYRTPGRRFGPLRRGADRAGAVLAIGDEPRGRARAGSPGGGRTTLPRR